MSASRRPRRLAVVCSVVLVAVPPVLAVGGAAWPLTPDAVVHPATIEEGRRVLTARDAYTQAILPRERKLLMAADDTPTDAEFRAFLGQQVLAWEDGDLKQLEPLVASVRERIRDRGFRLRLPRTVLLVKTTGRDLSLCAHTRANAIMLPQSWMKKGELFLEHILIHELFHVWSRHNPEQRDAAYRIIGFERCRPIPTPKELLPRQFTNPDAPVTEHVAEIEVAGEKVHVALIPVFEDENPPLGMEWGMGTSLTVEPLVVERRGAQWVPQRVDGKLRLLDITRLPGFYETIGMNTPYIVQPEEILAENFVLALKPDAGLILTPRIPEAMRRALQEASAPQAMQK